MTTFNEVIANRRTHYAISNEISVSDQKLQEIIELSLKHTPSAFNSQTTRIVLLTSNSHNKFWELVKSAIKKIVTSEQYTQSEAKLNSFKAGYGTVLFFEDGDAIASLEDKFSLYKSHFPKWSLQTNAMHQLVVWASFEEAGLGASLQHYDELIEDDVKVMLNLPNSWKILAQMPFGKPMSEPKAKEFLPLKDRMRIFN